MISISNLFEFELESLVKPVKRILLNQPQDNSILKKVNTTIVNNPNPIKALPPNMVGSRG